MFMLAKNNLAENQIEKIQCKKFRFFKYRPILEMNCRLKE